MKRILIMCLSFLLVLFLFLILNISYAEEPDSIDQINEGLKKYTELGRNLQELYNIMPKKENMKTILKWTIIICLNIWAFGYLMMRIDQQEQQIKNLFDIATQVLGDIQDIKGIKEVDIVKDIIKGLKNEGE